MDLRIATEDEPDAVSFRTYLTVAANATGTHDDDLVAEVERWDEIRRDAAEGQSEEELYLARHGGTLEEMKARLEGFRQVTGVLPQRFAELHSQAGGDLFDLTVAPVDGGDYRSSEA